MPATYDKKQMEEIIKIQYYHSPCGELILGSYDHHLCLCDWRYRKARLAIDARLQKGLKAQYKEEKSPVTDKAISQLNEYFDKKRTSFDLPLLFVGSDFQKKVWETLLQIPYGKLETYKGLSNRLYNPKAVRAVAAANGANSISLIVPCHRVIGSNKQLVGYAGGIQAKTKLLQLEGTFLDGQLRIF